MEFPVRIRNRHAAVPVSGMFAVCGCSGDTVRFDFDAEWNAFPEKTAYFEPQGAGGGTVTAVPFQGDVCPMPVTEQASLVRIGVSAGSLCTSTAARLPCAACITDIPADEAHPQQDIYNTLLSLLNHQQPQDICFGRYLVTLDGDYLATDAGDYLMTKE